MGDYPVARPVGAGFSDDEFETLTRVVRAVNAHEQLLTACHNLAAALAREYGLPLGECVSLEFAEYRNAIAAAEAR